MKARHSIPLVLAITLLSTMLMLVDGNIRNYCSCQAFLPVASPAVILQPGTRGSVTVSTNSTNANVNFAAPVGITYSRAFNASNVRVSTASGTPIDDSQAILSVVLAANSSVFIMYNAGNNRSSTEDYRGTGCAINVDGADVAFSWQSPYNNNHANSVTVIWAANLTAGSHVIKGRFFANYAGATVTIDMRQIVAFWFPSVVTAYVRSATASTTTSNSPVDDPQATLTFSLSGSVVAFIMYNAGNKAGSAEPATGKGLTINVDGTDITTRQRQSPYSRNYADSATIVYLAILTAGSHTVRGRFYSNSAGSTTTIDERQMIVFCFPQSSIEYSFVQSTTAVTTSSANPVDDNQAVLTPTLTQNSDSLVMYVGGNSPSTTEYAYGKGVELNMDGIDMLNSTSWQSPYSNNYADSATSMWCGLLANGSHTVKGRFFTSAAGNTVTVSHRQLLVLAFPTPTTYDYVLKIVNNIASNWRVYLEACNSSNIERLSGCTISFHDGSASDQIIVNDGVTTQSQGPQYDLLPSSTIYVGISNLQASTSGTSYLYTYLRITPTSASPFKVLKITFQVS